MVEPSSDTAKSSVAEADPVAKLATSENAGEVKTDAAEKKGHNAQSAAAFLSKIGSDKDKQQKLMQVIKALSAMRLTKEDSTPNAVLCRKVGATDDDEIRFVPALPTAEGAVSQIANETPDDLRGEPCLFQGSIGTAYNEKTLTEAGITHILTAASNIGARFKDTLTYKTLALLDSPNQNIVQHFEDATDWIEQVLREGQENKVLIHCFAGKSRASTITCSFLMRKQRLDLRQSLLHLRACRPIAFPNIGFLVQLKAYESTLFGKCSDVPLRLEQLFGIAPQPNAPYDEEIKQAQLSATGADGSEVIKSETKALADAEELLSMKQKESESTDTASAATQSQDASQKPN